MQGVLFALGGRFAGQTLFVEAGRLVFDYNHTGTHFTVHSDRPVPSGGCRLEMRYRRLADNEGSATLLIDGTEVGSGPVRTLAVFDSCEPLDIGCDLGTPVSEAYQSPYPFSGTIHSVAVDLGERGAAGGPRRTRSGLSPARQAYLLPDIRSPCRVNAEAPDRPHRARRESSVLPVQELPHWAERRIRRSPTCRRRAADLPPPATDLECQAE
jgi:hypothetical protein